MNAACMVVFEPRNDRALGIPALGLHDLDHGLDLVLSFDRIAHPNISII